MCEQITALISLLTCPVAFHFPMARPEETVLVSTVSSFYSMGCPGVAFNRCTFLYGENKLKILLSESLSIEENAI